MLIKEKRGLRRQYSQADYPLVKTRIHRLQKEIKNNLKIESQASWKKICNDISLETNHTESWRKIKNSLKLKGQCDYPALRLDANNVSGQFSNMAHFDHNNIGHSHQQNSTAPESLSDMPCVYQNTSVRSYYMTCLAFHT